MIWKWAPLGNKPLVQLKPSSLSVVVVATLFAAVSGTGSRAELDGLPVPSSLLLVSFCLMPHFSPVGSCSG